MPPPTLNSEEPLFPTVIDDFITMAQTLEVTP